MLLTKAVALLCSGTQGARSDASGSRGFIYTDSRNVPLALNGSLTQFEQVIREKLQDHHIARAFRDLVPGYIYNNSLRVWYPGLIVLTKLENSDDVTLNFARVSLTLLSDKTQTTIIPEQSARLTISDHEVNADHLLRYADRWASTLPVIKVRDIIDFFASP